MFRFYKETNFKKRKRIGVRKTNININLRLEISSKRSEEGGNGDRRSRFVLRLVVIPDCLALSINLNLIESKNMISSRLIFRGKIFENVESDYILIQNRSACFLHKIVKR